MFGIRHLLLYVLDIDLQINHKLNPQFGFDSHIPLTQRLMLNSHGEYQFGNKEDDFFFKSTDYQFENEFEIGLEFLLNEQFSLISVIDNHYGFGAGLNWRF